MSFPSCLQNRRSDLTPGRGQRHRARRDSFRGGTYRLNIEVLEARSLFSAFTDLQGGDFAAKSEAALGLVSAVGKPQALPPVTAGPQIDVRGEGTLSIDAAGDGVLHLSGTASHLGHYVCYAEIDSRAGDEAGARDGVGVVAFTAANGDQLVGVITWHINADGTGRASFAWRDAVTFGDGTTLKSTGRFAERRVPGAEASTQYDPGAGKAKFNEFSITKTA
jgi:hypothetical protein